MWDAGLPGFGVRVQPSGRRTFVLQTRIDGKERKATLGRFPAMKVKEARAAVSDRFETTEEEDAHGDAPDKSGSGAPRFDAFVKGVWWEQKFTRYKPSGQRGTGSYVKSRLLPVFGKLYLDEIERAFIVRWFETYSKTYPGGANRALEVLMSILEFAVLCGHIDVNPAKGIKKNPKKTLNRFLSVEEIRRLSRVLAQAEKEGPFQKQSADIVRLLLLTGCRHREITHLRWDMIQGDTIKFPDTKTGPREVHLTSKARNLIKAQPRTGSPWVFPSKRNPNRPRNTVHEFWVDIRKRADIEDVRVHDLRHTFASHAVIKGVSVPMVSKLLGHRKTAMTLRYTHVADKDAEAAAERIGATLNALLKGKAPGKVEGCKMISDRLH